MTVIAFQSKLPQSDGPWRPAELKALVDVWGSHGDREPLFASLKHAFDPQGILNAGRGPL